MYVNKFFTFALSMIVEYTEKQLVGYFRSHRVLFLSDKTCYVDYK